MKAMAQRSWAKGEPLVLLELPTPPPRPRELRVAVKAIGVNPVDWKMRQRGPLRLAARLIGPPPPVVFGVDFAGIVEAVGDRVTTVKVGDPVVGGTDFSRGQHGSQADTVLVREDQIALLPPGFDLELAASLPIAGVTAYRCIVEVGRLGPGQRALILGASGGVGQLAVQFVVDRGGSAVGVCSGKNAALVRALGASEVIDYTQGDPLAQARALGPFHVVLDAVGHHPGAACRRLLAPGGRHIMIANESLRGALNILVPPFTSRSVLGRPTTARLQAVVDAVVRGALKVRIEQRLPLADAERALALSQAGRMTGKILLIP